MQSKTQASLSNQQSIMELDQDIYGKLVKAGVFPQNSKMKLGAALSNGSKRVIVDQDISQNIESGFALSKYLIVIKDVLSVSIRSVTLLISHITIF